MISIFALCVLQENYITGGVLCQSKRCTTSEE